MEANEAQVDNLLTEPASQQETTPWYGQEYEEKVTQKGWKEPTDAVKSYFELEKMASSKIKMPTPESSADEIRAFYNKIGCPENPDGYEIQLSEDIPEFLRDEEIEGDLKKVAFEQGTSKQAFETIVKRFYERQAERLRQSREAGEKQLRDELKSNYDAEITIAKRFCEGCSEEFRGLLEQTGMGNNPIFIKEFIKLGKKTMNDTLIRGTQEDGEPDYEPKYKTSPEMYRAGEDEESKKARAWFTARGHKY